MVIHGVLQKKPREHGVRISQESSPGEMQSCVPGDLLARKIYQDIELQNKNYFSKIHKGSAQRATE